MNNLSITRKNNQVKFHYRKYCPACTSLEDRSACPFQLPYISRSGFQRTDLAVPIHSDCCPMLSLRKHTST